MAKLGIAIATALMICAVIPAPAAALECKHTPAEYAEAVRHLEAEAAKARVLAEQNPLYESDVARYPRMRKDAGSGRVGLTLILLTLFCAVNPGP
jgi:hypothetical protein